MSTTLEHLARWARELQPDAIPSRVLERARLQHLNLAGAVRAVAARPLAHGLAAAGSGRGAARLVTGGSASRRDAARLHAVLGSWLEHDDWLLFGHTGAAGVAAAWAFARGHQVETLLAATVAGNEVAGRLGAALLLAPDRERGQLVVPAVAAATVAGLLSGLDAPALAQALALACVGAGRCSLREQLGGDAAQAQAVGAATVAGLDAVELAGAGVQGPIDLLDVRGGLLDSLSPAPLRAAFTGLGRAWLSQTLAFAVQPGSPYLQVPLQAVGEILDRHVKAADKRLRADQIDHIEISLGLPGWSQVQLAQQHTSTDPTSLVRRLPQAIGLLVSEYAFGPAELSPERLEARRDSVAEVARRVEITHSWTRTADLVDHLVEVAGPLLVGLTNAELRAAGAAWGRRSGGLRPPPPALGEALAVLRTRPDRLLARLAWQSGDLADARLEELQLRVGADVRLFTTRGGSWRERRDLSIGSPGWPWADTVARVQAKWAGTGDPAAAVALMCSGPADDAVQALLAG